MLNNVHLIVVIWMVKNTFYVQTIDFRYIKLNSCSGYFSCKFTELTICKRTNLLMMILKYATKRRGSITIFVNILCNNEILKPCFLFFFKYSFFFLVQGSLVFSL